MKITLEALTTLEAIDRCGTFALAAKELHRVPSALTYTINNLESHFNVKIFNRKGHRATLTPMGIHFLQEGKKLLMAAKQLEKNIKMHQSGWEDVISIAYDQVIPFKNFLFLIEQFYEQCPGIELKWTGEILGGCWDALLTDRAMLAIGVNGEPPAREEVSLAHLGEVEFVFLVSPNHKLAKKVERITNEEILEQRLIVIADSARRFSARTSGILPGQNILTVSNFQEKIEAMVSGLGFGYLPLLMAQDYINSGKLIRKKVDKLKSKAMFSTAWRPNHIGKGVQWFVSKLSDKAIQKRIFNT